MANEQASDDRIDAESLTRNINQCFNLSMDSDVLEEQQTEFLAAGKRLRGYLLNLISARFERRTAELAAANRGIQATNSALEADLTKLKNAQAAIRKLGSLVAALDKALTVASKFV